MTTRDPRFPYNHLAILGVDKLKPYVPPVKEPMFMGLPDSWYDKPTWRCMSGHISKSYLNSEVKGSVCFSCFESVMLTSPTDTEDRKVKILDEDELFFIRRLGIKTTGALIRRNWGSDWGVQGQYGIRNHDDTKFIALSSDVRLLQDMVPNSTLIDKEW